MSLFLTFLCTGIRLSRPSLSTESFFWNQPAAPVTWSAVIGWTSWKGAWGTALSSGDLLWLTIESLRFAPSGCWGIGSGTCILPKGNFCPFPLNFASRRTWFAYENRSWSGLLFSYPRFWLWAGLCRCRFDSRFSFGSAPAFFRPVGPSLIYCCRGLTAFRCCIE